MSFECNVYHRQLRAEICRWFLTSLPIYMRVLQFFFIEPLICFGSSDSLLCWDFDLDYYVATIVPLSTAIVRPPLSLPPPSCCSLVQITREIHSRKSTYSHLSTTTITVTTNWRRRKKLDNKNIIIIFSPLYVNIRTFSSFLFLLF